MSLYGLFRKSLRGSLFGVFNSCIWECGDQYQYNGTLVVEDSEPQNPTLNF